jgi:uncharacterized membrane protein
VDNRKSRIRHLAKTLTWRLIASATTFTLFYIFTEDVKSAGLVTTIEFFLKMLFYYMHERAWFKYGRLGRDDK